MCAPFLAIIWKSIASPFSVRAQKGVLDPTPTLRDHTERGGIVIYTRPAQGRHSRKKQ